MKTPFQPKLDEEPFGWFATPDFYRADGRMICKVCGLPYSRHPDYPLFWFLTIICNGDLVKL